MAETDTILASIQEGNRLNGYQNEVRKFLKENPHTIVILDDDPTGTQTVKNIPVITDWSEKALESELIQNSIFFVLTNSRALQRRKAEKLSKTIGVRLKKLARKHGKKLLVISRGDSTLRGHYPYEVEILGQALGMEETKHVLIPAFFEGGRYTYKDVHYVKEAGNFIPAAQTPFAKDSTFGYTQSNLRKYILEKYEGNLEPDTITSVSIDSLRSGKIHDQLNDMIARRHCLVVNGTSHADLEAFALAALKSESNLIYRTAASFINAIIGERPAGLLDKSDLNLKSTRGGLVVIGSYVPKTTAQLGVLKDKYVAEYIELDVNEIFNDTDLYNSLKKKAQCIDQWLTIGLNVVIYTSRIVKKGSSKVESLDIVNAVSRALLLLVKYIKVEPRFILAKGGITSSDIAVKSLGISRATVVGQLVEGVPVWRGDKNVKFPGILYVIFPGNVGSKEDLFNALTKLE